MRKNQSITEKQRIAGIIADMVQEKDTIMLDVSSTSVYIAKELKKKEQLTVITNSIEIIVEFYNMPNWTVISTGGTVRADSFALGGPHTDELLSSYHVDKAIVSCKGLDLKDGITDYVEQDANSKRMMLRAARERILAVDHTKFDTTAFIRVTDWSSFTKVVTDQEPPGKWMEEFNRRRIECIYP